jgi:HemY protein
MLRLILFLAFIIALASGLAWLADRPGLIVVNWEGYQAEVSVFHAVVALAFLTGLALVTWSLLRHIWESPATIGSYFKRRRQKHGLDALSSGMIAIGAGDRSTATRYAIQARKSMPNEPLTHLLRAQAAQLSGDKATARRIYESMLAVPDTEQLGLRGLFLEAQREGETEAAKQFAQRAISLNPKLSWPVDALFDLQCKDHAWEGALETLAIARKNGHIEKASAERRRAVLLAAQAQELEDKDPERALNLALDAHNLATDLVPAAAIAGRLLASRGSTPKATKILQKTWQKSPHPDLATAFAYARLGDSPVDRLDRVKKLAGLNPHSLESSIALANAAIEAKDFDVARRALEPLLDNRLTQRACTLMARIEGEQHGDKGAVREWLARAVNAPRDPAWTADGVVSDHWEAVSPVTGALDAFQWRVPVESMEKTADEIVARKLEELVALGAPLDVAAKDVTPSGPAEKPVESKPPKPASDVVDADVVDVDAEPVTEARSTATSNVKPETSRQTTAPKAESEQPKKKIDAPITESVAAAAAKPNADKREAVEPEADLDPAESHEPAEVLQEKSAPGEAKVTFAKSAGAVAQSATTKPDRSMPDTVIAAEAESKPADPSNSDQSVDKVETEEPAPELRVRPSRASVMIEEKTPARTASATEAKKPSKLDESKDKADKKHSDSSAKRAPASASPPPSSKAKRSDSAKGEPLIFVSPPAPDDPGPDGDAPAEVPSGPPKPYRVHS